MLELLTLLLPISTTKIFIKEDYPNGRYVRSPAIDNELIVWLVFAQSRPTTICTKQMLFKLAEFVTANPRMQIALYLMIRWRVNLMISLHGWQGMLGYNLYKPASW